MNDILIVTGTCGVGKSTICWHWAEQRLGATIDCDYFRTWIRNPALHAANAYQEPLLARHAILLAEDYLAMGLDVAIDNVWTPDGLEVLRRRLAEKARLRIVRLTCTAAENHARDERRSPSDVMGGRVDELRAELDALPWPEYVIELDTTGQTVVQTLQAIEMLFERDTLAGLTLRPSTEEDAAFLYDTLKATMEDYVRQTWGWNEQDQQARFRATFEPGKDHVVLLDGQPIGVFCTERGEDEVFIDKIYILPAYQRRGIGTHLITTVQNEAFAQGLPVALRVLKVNPARQLYGRLGFEQVDETESSYVMRATPPKG